MVETKSFVVEGAPKAVGPYPHARQVGDLLFVCGMGPRQPHSDEIPGLVLNEDGSVHSHDIEKQTKATIENIKVILEACGSSLDKVVDVQAFLTDMKNDFKKFNKVFAHYFGEVGPTRTTIEVTSLPTPIAVELKVIAIKGARP